VDFHDYKGVVSASELAAGDETAFLKAFLRLNVPI
jgi:hypothetical protein